MRCHVELAKHLAGWLMLPLREQGTKKGHKKEAQGQQPCASNHLTIHFPVRAVTGKCATHDLALLIVRGGALVNALAEKTALGDAGQFLIGCAFLVKRLLQRAGKLVEA